MKKKKPKRGYWYKFHITECVLCGAGGTTKERQYSLKPDDFAEIYDYSQFVCDAHYLYGF